MRFVFAPLDRILLGVSFKDPVSTDLPSLNFSFQLKAIA